MTQPGDPSLPAAPHLLLVQLGHIGQALQQRHGDYGRLYRSAAAPAVAQWQVLPLIDQPAAPLPDLRQFAGVVVSGGRSMVTDNGPWLQPGMTLLRAALAQRVPVLAVCLGHQLLAHTLGAKVGDHGRGWVLGTPEVQLLPAAQEDPLFAGLPARFPASVSHQQAVLKAAETMQPLARTDYDACHAFRAGPCAWGVQFHPEFTFEYMRDLLTVRGDAVDAAAGPGTAAQRLATLRPVPLATSVVQRFVELCARARAESRIVSPDRRVQGGRQPVLRPNNSPGRLPLRRAPGGVAQ